MEIVLHAMNRIVITVSHVQMLLYSNKTVCVKLLVTMDSMLTVFRLASLVMLNAHLVLLQEWIVAALVQQAFT